MRAGDAAAGIESAGAALPEPSAPPPAETPPARIASAETPDTVQHPGEQTAHEATAAESVAAALPNLPPPAPAAVPPAQTASTDTPDPLQNAGEQTAVAAAAVESAGAALPDPAATPPADTLPVDMPAVDMPAVDLPAVRIASADMADAAQGASAEIAVKVADARGDSVVLPEPPPPAAPPVRLVSLFRSVTPDEELKPAKRPLETLNECLVAQICIDDYLWSLYESTPKVDTNKVTERIRTTVKKKNKTLTVMKTITKYVIADFTWKDPAAAQRAGMSLQDYVIGGMERSFRVKLYRALRAMEDAGLMPGITSAFRDDYRQGIASGNKAASDSSYHGGSRRGGYGHGLAADLVSVKGETRLQRFASSRELWKWIDAHETELGVGRPYLDRDPPHVGAIHGKEYADKRGGVRARLARLAARLLPRLQSPPQVAARAVRTSETKAR